MIMLRTKKIGIPSNESHSIEIVLILLQCFKGLQALKYNEIEWTTMFRTVFENLKIWILLSSHPYP